jgi:predicted Zn finger-like uncharacterized protein
MITNCPSCSRKLRVPDDLLGKPVKCPTCGHMFQASAAAESSSEAVAVSQPSNPPVNLELDSSGDAAHETQDYPGPIVPSSESVQPREQATQLVPCPGCDKLIERGVGRCPYCGVVPEDYEEEDDRPWEERRFRGRRDAEPHRGVLIMVLGIVSIVLVATIFLGFLGIPLGIAAWVMGQKDLRKMRDNVMDDEGMGLTQAGWVCGIIGTILSTLCGLGLLAYFAFIFTMMRLVTSGPMPGGPAPPVTVKKALSAPPVKQVDKDVPAKK